MTKNSNRENLLKVKQALTAKYESLAKVSKSQVKRKELLYNAEKYRRQAVILARQGSVKG